MPSKYYCQNCGSEIKPTDTICPKCGKNLSEVGRTIEVTITETLAISDSVETKLTKEQQDIVKKVLKAIKKELAKKEIDSITFGFPQLISVKIKNKEKTGIQGMTEKGEQGMTEEQRRIEEQRRFRRDSGMLVLGVVLGGLFGIIGGLWSAYYAEWFKSTYKNPDWTLTIIWSSIALVALLAFLIWWSVKRLRS